MKISIIIPTYNAEPFLHELLTALNRQTISDYEIIVIDSSSSDATQKIARTFEVELIVIPQSEFDHGGTRTFAARSAQGEIIVFLTQDSLPADENSIANLIKIFGDSTVVAGYGRQLPYPDAKPFGEHLRLFNYPPESKVKSFEDRLQLGIKTTFLSDSFSAYRKSALEEIGWFKEQLIFGEDAVATAMFLLKGYNIAYSSDARVYHSHDYSMVEDFKRYFDTGVFHSSESWILEKFGCAENAGNQYVKSELKFLLKKRRYDLIPQFFIRNFFKLFGYKLGRMYKKLPRFVILKCSMSKHWWKSKAL